MKNPWPEPENGGKLQQLIDDGQSVDKSFEKSAFFMDCPLPLLCFRVVQKKKNLPHFLRPQNLCTHTLVPGPLKMCFCKLDWRGGFSHLLALRFSICISVKCVCIYWPFQMALFENDSFYSFYSSQGFSLCIPGYFGNNSAFNSIQVLRPSFSESEALFAYKTPRLTPNCFPHLTKKPNGFLNSKKSTPEPLEFGPIFHSFGPISSSIENVRALIWLKSGITGDFL